MANTVKDGKLLSPFVYCIEVAFVFFLIYPLSVLVFEEYLIAPVFSLPTFVVLLSSAKVAGIMVLLYGN